MIESNHPASIPEHIAIIMDGNGRWAKLRGEPRYKGHHQGVKSVREVVKACLRLGVHTLTLFAFSSENWKRPRNEVGMLMELFLTALGSEAKELDSHGVKIHFIGSRAYLPANVQYAMEDAEAQTAANELLTLVVAVSYGGHWDITQAVQQLGSRILEGEVTPESITESDIAGHLSTADLSLPDLFIRTGGERRISNFLLWQLAYTELYFTDTLWPDFGEASLEAALEDYTSRQRRYGMTSEQVVDQQVSNA